MHELSLAYSLVEMAEDHLRQNEATKVCSITLSIGAHSGVVKSAMEFAFPEAVRDKVCWNGCELVIKEVAVKLFCSECGKNQFPEVDMMICPICHSGNVEILEGKDFFLQSMEVE